MAYRKDQETMAERHTELNVPPPYQRLPNDHLQDNEYSTEAAYQDGQRDFSQERTEAIIRMTFTEKPPTETLPNQEMPRSANAMYKAAFREQKRAPITVSMTTDSEAYVLDTDQ